MNKFILILAITATAALPSNASAQAVSPSALDKCNALYKPGDSTSVQAQANCLRTLETMSREESQTDRTAIDAQRYQNNGYYSGGYYRPYRQQYNSSYERHDGDTGRLLAGALLGGLIVAVASGGHHHGHH